MAHADCPAALLSWLMKNYKYYDFILGGYV